MSNTIIEILKYSASVNKNRIITSTLVTDEHGRYGFLNEYFGENFYIECSAFICGMIDDFFDFRKGSKDECKFYKLLENDVCVGYYVVQNSDSDEFKFNYSNNKFDKPLSAEAANIAVNLRMLNYFAFSKLESRFMKLYSALFSFAFHHPEFEMISEVVSI